MASVITIHGVLSDPLADASLPSQSRTVLAPGESLEWRTPGSHLASCLRNHREVAHVLEQTVPGGALVIIVLRSESEEVLDLIFNAQRELYSLFPVTLIDVNVSLESAISNIAALQSSSIVWF